MLGGIINLLLVLNPTKKEDNIYMLFTLIVSFDYFLNPIELLHKIIDDITHDNYSLFEWSNLDFGWNKGYLLMLLSILYLLSFLIPMKKWYWSGFLVKRYLRGKGCLKLPIDGFVLWISFGCHLRSYSNRQ